jgi:hypothetical protein
MNDYPADISQLDLENIEYPRAAIHAIKRLARSRPWSGTVEERQRKLLRVVADLAAAHGTSVPRVIFDLRGPNSDSSHYCPSTKTIVLRGPSPSVITTLHESYHHILGSSEHYVGGQLQRPSGVVWQRPRRWPKVYSDLTAAKARRRVGG